MAIEEKKKKRRISGASALTTIKDLFVGKTGLKPLNSRKEYKESIANIDDLNKEIDTSLYGSDYEFEMENKRDLDKIRKISSNLDNQFSKSTGGADVIDLLAKISNTSEDKSTRRLDSLYKRRDNLELFNQVDLGIINEIFTSEKDRLMLYSDYQSLAEYIPQLSQAINAIVNCIMSPDDFTKTTFSLMYNKESVDTEKATDNKIIENLRKIEKTYKIENDAKSIIKDAEILGDRFEAVLPMDREFNKMLSEDAADFYGKGKVLTENTVNITESEITEFFHLFGNSKNKALSEADVKQFKSEVADFINETFEIGTREKFFSRFSTLAEDFKDIPRVNGVDFGFDNRLRKFKVHGDTISKHNALSNFTVTHGSDGYEGLKADKDKYYIKGSYRITLDPRRVVKIYSNKVTFGYYYLEPIDTLSDPIQMKTGNRFFTYNLMQATDVVTDSTYFNNPKTRLIVDLLARNISTKINKKFIADNDSFKMILFDLMKQNYMFNNRIRITYFTPADIIHFYPELDEETGYGISRLHRVLFTAKLYIAVLTCNLMMKLSRSQERRTFYVETGLDRADEENCYQLIRDIKARDVRMSDLKSIDSIFNVAGRFQDFVIPTVSGEAAVRIESTPGQNSEIDDELTQYLLKATISGIGVPSSYIAISEEMDYARSISMQNGEFLRSIVVEQQTFSEHFSNLYRSLYVNEFVGDKNNSKAPVNNAESEDDDIEKINIDGIKVEFPSPASLNITNLTESFNNVKSLVDVVTDVIVGNEAEGGQGGIKFFLTKKLVEKYLPTIDWKEIDNLRIESEIEMKKDELVKKSSKDEGLGGDESDTGFGGGGSFGADTGSGGGDNNNPFGDTGDMGGFGESPSGDENNPESSEFGNFDAGNNNLPDMGSVENGSGNTTPGVGATTGENQASPSGNPI